MAEATFPPIATEEPAEAAPATDGLATDPAPSSAEEAAGTKRKFDEAADGPGGEEDEHQNKRIASATEAGTTTSAEGGDPVVDGQPVSAGLDVAPDAAETAPTALVADAAAAAEPAASQAATAGPNGDAVEAAPVEQQPDGSGQEVPLHAEQQPAGEQPVDAAAMAAAQAQAAVTAAALTQSAGALEQMLQIPGTMVGKLIGKQGETIKGLQYSTNTRIQIDHTTPGDLKTVTVSGPSPDLVQQAVTQINGLISEASGPSAGDMSENVECPPGIVGRIIGRGGETIRGLQQASGAHIVVNQDFPEGVARQISITGRPDAVQRAVSMVSELIQGEPGSAQAIIQKRTLQFGAGVSRVLECPKGMVGRVIGKGGETIKALQKQFSCNIQIEQNSDPMTITIAGQPHTVDPCAAAVQEIIAGGNPFGANAPPNFAGGDAGAYGQAGAYGAPAYGAAYGGGYAQPYGQPAYGAPYGAAPAYGGYAAPAPGYGGYGGYPGGADPYAAQQQGYGQQGYGAQPAAGGAPAGGAGAGVWQELPDPEGRPYYYNTQTGVSQWEKPVEMG